MSRRNHPEPDFSSTLVNFTKPPVPVYRSPSSPAQLHRVGNTPSTCRRLDKLANSQLPAQNTDRFPPS